MRQGLKPDFLSGIRVLDFTRVLAGPYATRVFADFGAEVIKVQPGKNARCVEKHRDAYFRTWNRNKRGITVDMGHPESKRFIKRLVHICDIVVENFSPRVMRNWGLAYETLLESRPDLIMLSLSGFGQTGPWKDYVAYAPTVHALGGLTHMTAERDDEPIGPGFAYGDIMSGLWGVYAVLAALENRRRTGDGEYIDLSEYEVICSLMGPTLMETAKQGRAPLPNGNRGDDVAAPSGCYACKGGDRWCVLSVVTEAQWCSLCHIINPALASDERFLTAERRKTHYLQLDAEIEAWTRKQNPESAVKMLQAEGIPSGVVQDAREVAADPQHIARHFFAGGASGADDGSIRSDVTPLLMERDVPVQWRDAPEAGEANAYVCRELLGMSEAEFGSLVREGIIG
jgi:crotonobetainyl-CoA:carnitine CoA-transferase CaiB-like acyl-CoA transferase